MVKGGRDDGEGKGQRQRREEEKGGGDYKIWRRKDGEGGMTEERPKEGE